jgi:hypothetical protein
MSKKAKLLEKLRNNPKSIRFEEIDLILTSYGFTRRQPSGGSSHYIPPTASRRGRSSIITAIAG